MKQMIYDGKPVTQLLDLNWFDDGTAYAVFNVRGSYPCAYIQFPDIEKVKDYDSFVIDEDEMDYDMIHYGFTYLGTLDNLGLHGKWIGWDYAHFGDYCSYSGMSKFNHPVDEKKWTTEEVSEACQKALDYIRKGKYEIFED